MCGMHVTAQCSMCVVEVIIKGFLGKMVLQFRRMGRIFLGDGVWKSIAQSLQHVQTSEVGNCLIISGSQILEPRQ